MFFLILTYHITESHASLLFKKQMHHNRSRRGSFQANCIIITSFEHASQSLKGIVSVKFCAKTYSSGTQPFVMPPRALITLPRLKNPLQIRLLNCLI